jgi:hypothetical protein
MPVKRIWVALLCVVAVVLIVALRPHGMPRRSVADGGLFQRAWEPVAAPNRLSSIGGLVTDSMGKSMASARVCAVYSSFAPGPPQGTCSGTDGHGRYVLHGLPVGGYLVTAARAGFLTGSAQGGRPVEVVDGTPLTGVDIVLQAGGARVSGLVSDATGGVVAHATIRAERHAAPRAAVDVEADDLGQFELWFPPGIVILTAHAVGYAPATWSGPTPTQNVRLVLTPGARLRGVVVAAGDGSPDSDVVVLAFPLGAPASTEPPSSTSRVDGAFEIGGVEPGRYKLVATGEGRRGELEPPIQVPLGTTIENIRIAVGPAATISGQVLLSRTGRPCEQGRVNLGPPDPAQPPPEEFNPAAEDHPGLGLTANIGLMGSVHFPAVPRGRYFVSVQCYHNVLREGPRVLDVEASALSNLMWKVSLGAGLSIRERIFWFSSPDGRTRRAV